MFTAEIAFGKLNGIRNKKNIHIVKIYKSSSYVLDFSILR